MPDRRSRTAALLAVWMLLVGAGTAHGATPTVVIEPSGPLPDGDQTITLTGSGFDAGANDGVGIYVVFGPLTETPTYYTDALLYGAARWVHPGAAAGPGQAALEADGSFTTTLDIQPRYVDGHDAAIDCVATPCHVITMAAHGVPDRSQDTFTPVTFGPAASATSGAAIPWLIPGAALAVLAVILIASLVRWQHRPARHPQDSGDVGP